MHMSEPEKEKAYRRIRQSRSQETNPEDLTGESQTNGEFQAPTAEVEEILATAREMSRRYHILLPPPFSPFESLPRLPERSRSNNAVENMRKLPKVEEVKEEPQLVCPQCRTHVPISSRFCLSCGFPLKQEEAETSEESSGPPSRNRSVRFGEDSDKPEGKRIFEVVDIKPRKLKK